jgi:hypothetical protein
VYLECHVCFDQQPAAASQWISTSVVQLLTNIAVGELLDLLLVDPARCFTEYLPPMTEIRAELPVC